MSQQLSQANLGTATPSPRIRRNPSTESPLDETSCTLCDCSEFRMGKAAIICQCGHHYEDHEDPQPRSKEGSPT